MHSLQRMSCIGASLGNAKPCKRDSIEILLRQDAWSHLKYGKGYERSLSWRLSKYAKGEDYWQVWFALEYLASNI